jgi:excisionase family DNA binding protein
MSNKRSPIQAGSVERYAALKRVERRTGSLSLASEFMALRDQATGGAPAVIQIPDGNASTETEIAISGDAFLTLEQAARYIQLPQSYLRELIEGGTLAARNVGPRAGGRYRLRRADLERL